ncbi:MAG TPA: porin family protein [Lacibacter sp.]|nr:porin family protein [Lacibacter sp.]HMO87636.1 porin family protein [Lacibacter sp.]HMP86965.1 porin family protein [Lacibacter sp.]
MHKHLILFIFTATLASSALAQGFKIGPKLGANIGKIEGAGFSDMYTLGYHVGGFTEIDFSKKLGIQAEVLWNQIGADTVSGFDAIYQNINGDDFSNPRLNYLSIPVLLSYRPTKILALQAGPQFGVLIDKNRNLLQNGQEAFRNGDLSLLLGAQLNLLKFRVYGRYAIGLSDISDATVPGEWKSTGFQLGVGIAL